MFKVILFSKMDVGGPSSRKKDKEWCWNNIGGPLGENCHLLTKTMNFPVGGDSCYHPLPQELSRTGQGPGYGTTPLEGRLTLSHAKEIGGLTIPLMKVCLPRIPAPWHSPCKPRDSVGSSPSF